MLYMRAELGWLYTKGTAKTKLPAGTGALMVSLALKLLNLIVAQLSDRAVSHAGFCQIFLLRKGKKRVYHAYLT